MNTILEQCLSLIDLGQLEKEIKTNPTTKFEEKDIEAIKNGELDVIIYVLKSAISRQAKANKFSLVFWLNEIVAIFYKIQGVINT